MDREKIEAGAGLILDGLGVDRNNENFKETPRRVAKAFMELCSGIDVDLEEEVFSRSFQAPTVEHLPTSIQNIRAWSVCPHHLLPVILEVDVTYMPFERVLGLSKVHRLVQALAHRPVLQEELTFNIANAMHTRLRCGVKVKVSGIHMCMVARGVKAGADAKVVTEAELGNTPT